MSSEPKYTIQMDIDSSVEQVAAILKKHFEAYLSTYVTNEGQSFELVNGSRVLHRTTYQDLLSLANWDLQGIGKEVIFAISADIAANLLGRFE